MRLRNVDEIVFPDYTRLFTQCPKMMDHSLEPNIDSRIDGNPSTQKVPPNHTSVFR